MCIVIHAWFIACFVLCTLDLCEYAAVCQLDVGTVLHMLTVGGLCLFV